VPRETAVAADIECRLAPLGAWLAAACSDIEFARLFGSPSTGGARLRSDIDLAMYVAESADAPGVRRG
jgi:predicted nucleotidyltransferase